MFVLLFGMLIFLFTFSFFFTFLCLSFSFVCSINFIFFFLFGMFLFSIHSLVFFLLCLLSCSIYFILSFSLVCSFFLSTFYFSFSCVCCHVLPILYFLIFCMFPSPAEVSKFNYFTPTLKMAGWKTTLKRTRDGQVFDCTSKSWNSLYNSHPNPQNFKCMLKLLAFLHFIWKYGDMYTRSRSVPVTFTTVCQVTYLP